MVLTVRSDVYFCVPISGQLILQPIEFHQISYTLCTIRRPLHILLESDILNAMFLLRPDFSSI